MCSNISLFLLFHWYSSQYYWGINYMQQNESFLNVLKFSEFWNIYSLMELLCKSRYRTIISPQNILLCPSLIFPKSRTQTTTVLLCQYTLNLSNLEFQTNGNSVNSCLLASFSQYVFRMHPCYHVYVSHSYYWLAFSSLIDRHLGCCQFWAVMKKVAMSMWMQIFL